MNNTSPVYLDHAATTPMLPDAVAAMSEELSRLGHPSSRHGMGLRARQVVEESREQIAGMLGARPEEVIFTSSGTEADNLAVKGLFWGRRAADPHRVLVLTSPAEHHAVLGSARWLAAAEGAKVGWLAADESGRVQPSALRDALRVQPGRAALISVMWANNEVGTVQPVPVLAAVAREHGVPFHTDAVQAAAQLPVNFAASGVDAMTIAGHKFGGPARAAALLLRRGVAAVPLLHGGHAHETRAGTPDVPAIRAFAVAVMASAAARDSEAKRLSALRDDLIRQVLSAVPDAILNGPPPGPDRLPGNAHFSFPGCEGDALLLILDAQGIACSTGSACTAGVPQPSHVLLAMGAGELRARGSLRFSLGHASTQADVDALGTVIGAAVARARRAWPG